MSTIAVTATDSELLRLVIVVVVVGAAISSSLIYVDVPYQKYRRRALYSVYIIDSSNIFFVILSSI